MRIGNRPAHGQLTTEPHTPRHWFSNMLNATFNALHLRGGY